MPIGLYFLLATRRHPTIPALRHCRASREHFSTPGARALLVSHWAVNSEATVKLITQAFDEIKADPKLGRAEAMRRSMVAMIGTAGLAHPSLWAPFVVVGEGAPAR
jgi:CHAT domain-containing protein